MKKRMKFRVAVWVCLAVFALGVGVWAGTISQKPYGIATPYWYGYSSNAPSTYYLAHPTLSANDTAVGLAATQTLTNKTLTSPTITGPTITDATMITTRSFELPIGAAIVNGAPIAADGTANTDPGTALNDGVPAIVWTSPEVTPAQWSFRLPADYSSGLSFRVLVSASSNSQAYDWQLYVNKDATIFDAAAFGQDLVHQATTYPTTMNEVLTFTPDATAIAGIAAGNLITLDLWRYNDGDYGAGNAEVKNVTVLYSAAR